MRAHVFQRADDGRFWLRRRVFRRQMMERSTPRSLLLVPGLLCVDRTFSTSTDVGFHTSNNDWPHGGREGREGVVKIYDGGESVARDMGLRRLPSGRASKTATHPHRDAVSARFCPIPVVSSAEPLIQRENGRFNNVSLEILLGDLIPSFLPCLRLDTNIKHPPNLQGQTWIQRQRKSFRRVHFVSRHIPEDSDGSATHRIVNSALTAPPGSKVGVIPSVAPSVWLTGSPCQAPSAAAGTATTV